MNSSYPDMEWEDIIELLEDVVFDYTPEVRMLFYEDLINYIRGEMVVTEEELEDDDED